MKHAHTTWVAVSSTALKKNIQQFKKIVGPHTELMAVVKSNAYGHGMIESAKLFKKYGCAWIGTVDLEEATILRTAGYRGNLLVLSYYSQDKLKQAIRQNIQLTIYHESAAKRISALAKRMRRTAHVHVKADTGTSRLGLPYQTAASVITKINQLPNIAINGLFTHLADAENPDQAFTSIQQQRFESLLQALRRKNISIPYKHIACSAATILNQHTHYDLVRLGISAYGLWSVQGTQHIRSQVDLIPALSWHTRVLQVKTIAKGETVGYNRTYRAKHKMRIAVIPVGYHEGYDRSLSNKSAVLINGRRCSVRGNVCMNLTMVDITNIRQTVRPGTIATLIGKQGKQEITADELSQQAGTINYEIVARIHPSLPRIYTK